MRYFFFSYIYLKLDNSYGYGNITKESILFPSIKSLDESILKDKEIKRYVIMNSFEFKSKEDYLNFEIVK